jgi:hypothetical protein
MTYATAGTVHSHHGHHHQVNAPQVHNGQSCSNCNDHLEPLAKFCGSCGFIVAPSSFNINQYAHAYQVDCEGAAEAEETIAAPQTAPVKAAPAFARIPSSNPRAGELNEESQKLMIQLARERIFLYFLIGSFLCINLFGCWVAWTCYTGFIGDEMSKTMMAMTPFLFINLLGLIVLSPIKGTRAEIGRLKERMNHNRFKIQFGHLH